jgi:uncharacterized glyoxalase superfamily protein PhnB
VKDVDDLYQKVLSQDQDYHLQTSGPPKDHPWGERSFLLIDPDGNRWEVTQSPTDKGMLVDK